MGDARLTMTAEAGANLRGGGTGAPGRGRWLRRSQLRVCPPVSSSWRATASSAGVTTVGRPPTRPAGPWPATRSRRPHRRHPHRDRAHRPRRTRHRDHGAIQVDDPDPRRREAAQRQPAARDGTGIGADRTTLSATTFRQNVICQVDRARPVPTVVWPPRRNRSVHPALGGDRARGLPGLGCAAARTERPGRNGSVRTELCHRVGGVDHVLTTGLRLWSARAG